MRFLKALIALAFISIVLGGVALGAGWLWLQSEVEKPGPAPQETTFEVKSGEHLASVADRLEERGLIRYARAMRLHARLEGREAAIKVGEYAIPPRASISSILEKLVSGDVIEYRITIPEGLTSAQILRRVEAHGLCVPFHTDYSRYEQHCARACYALRVLCLLSVALGTLEP